MCQGSQRLRAVTYAGVGFDEFVLQVWDCNVNGEPAEAFPLKGKERLLLEERSTGLKGDFALTVLTPRFLAVPHKGIPHPSQFASPKQVASSSVQLRDSPPPATGVWLCVSHHSLFL